MDKKHFLAAIVKLPCGYNKEFLEYSTEHSSP